MTDHAMTSLPSSPTPPDAPTPPQLAGLHHLVATFLDLDLPYGTVHSYDVRALASLLRAYEGMRAERTLLAMLAADTPQFDNPLVAWEAKALRDRILAARASAPDRAPENANG